MAITGIDTIEGKQIIAAGAVSAKSAEMAYNDENGNPITGYLTAVPEGYATTGDLNDLVTSISETYQPTAGMTAYQPAGDYYSASNPSGFISEVPTGTMNESAFGYDANDKISGYNGSAFAGGSTLPSAFVVSADGQAYKSVPNVLTGVTGYFYDLGDIEYYTKFSNVQNNVQYTLDTHTYEYMSVYTITGDNKHVYIQAEYTDGDTHSFTLTNYNPNEGDVYVELFTDDYYGGEITLSADGNILKPYALKDEFPQSATEAIETVTANSADWNGTTDTVSSNSGVWGGSALPISAGPGIKFEMVNDTLVASTSGYVWQSALLFHTDTPITQTTYTLSDNCSNYDKLEVDFYDINGWRTQMDCSIPTNLAASGTRGGYFSVVPASTATGANVWFKAFNWTAANTTWSCYCSEIAAQGGSTTQTVNANQPENPPKVVNIIGWKRVGGN